MTSNANQERLQMQVAGKETLADGVVRLTLVDESGAAAPAWTPGSHIDRVLDDTITRQYSLCGDPGDTTSLTVAVLREADGRGGSIRVHAGIILGLEDTMSAKDNVRIMERSKSPAVLTYYDVGNSTQNSFNVVEEIRWLGNDRICEMHLKDNPHYLGEGKINFPAVIEAMTAIGFDKWAELETDAPKELKSDMRRNLGFIRGLAAKS